MRARRKGGATRALLGLLAALATAFAPAVAQADQIVVYKRGDTIRFDPDVGRELMEIVLVTYDSAAGGVVKQETLETFHHLSDDNEIITAAKITEDVRQAFVIEKVGDKYYFRGAREAVQAQAAAPSPAAVPAPQTPRLGSGPLVMPPAAPKQAGAEETGPFAGTEEAPVAGAEAAAAPPPVAPTASSGAEELTGAQASSGGTAPTPAVSTPAVPTPAAASPAYETGTAIEELGGVEELTPSSAAPDALDPFTAGSQARTPQVPQASAASEAPLASPNEITAAPTAAEAVLSVRDKVKSVARQVVAINPRAKGSAKQRTLIINGAFTTSLRDYERPELEQVIGFVGEEGLTRTQEYYVLRSFGWALQQSDSPDKAVVFYDRCTELIPENYSAHLQKGYAHEKVGRNEEAIRAYAKTLTLNPRRVAVRLYRLAETAQETEHISRDNMQALMRGMRPVVRSLREKDDDLAKEQGKELHAMVEGWLTAPPPSSEPEGLDPLGPLDPGPGTAPEFTEPPGGTDPFEKALEDE